jgi:hypothetical protein
VRILAGVLALLLALVGPTLIRLASGHRYWRKRALNAEELLWYYDAAAMAAVHNITFEEWKRRWGL